MVLRAIEPYMCGKLNSYVSCSSVETREDRVWLYVGTKKIWALNCDVVNVFYSSDTLKHTIILQKGLELFFY